MSLSRFLFAVLFFVVAYFVNFLNVFSSTPESQSLYSSCEYLHLPNHNLIGAEDGTPFDDDTVLFTQANLPELEHNTQPLSSLPRGQLFAVQGLKSQSLRVSAIELTNYPAAEQLFFFPHGIFLQKELNLLRVINHSMSSGGERIETFRVSKDAETNRITAEFLYASTMPVKFNGVSNDLAFITENRFIISNWMQFSIPLTGSKDQPVWKVLLTLAAHITGIKTTYLWDCEYRINAEATCEQVPESAGIVMNGVQFDGHRTLLAADSLSRQIKIFRLGEESDANSAAKEDKQQQQQQQPSLKLIQTVQTNSMPDNLTYDAKNKVFYVAGMKSVLEFLKLQMQTEEIQTNTSNKPTVTNQSLAEAIKLNEATGNYEVSTLFASSNTIVGMSTAFTASNDDSYLFLFSFIDKAPVVCKRVINSH